MYTIDYLVHGIWREQGDPRVLVLPFFADGPWKVFAVSLTYLAFVKVWGPAFMAGRKPFELRPLMLLYNGFLIGFNGIGAMMAFWITDYGYNSWKCDGMDPKTDNFKENLLVFFGWMYFASKIADFMDTIFFVLRKKDSQVTFLHVFHHGVMPLVAYFGLKFHPGGYSSFLPMTNLLVHAVMYSYYALSAAGTEFKQYLWWKKYITQMQIVQFILTLVHSTKAVFVPNCWPTWLALCEGIHAALFLYMFTAFYIRAYCKPVTVKTVKDN
ncbi:Elongation of very long chain fatty acids protein 1 [Halotydeus destructor]|nr:Elongation of very long chain fatty acids protein 1 [Halotydeus destructor]